MLASPLLLVVAILALLALSCLATLRRLARERRFISRLKAREAVSPRRSIRMAEFSPEEQVIARELREAGIVRGEGRSCYLDPSAAAERQWKRTRLTISSGLLLVLAVAVTFLLLRR